MVESYYLEHLKQNLKELAAFEEGMLGITGKQYEKVRDSLEVPPQYVVNIRLGKPLRGIVLRGDDYIEHLETGYFLQYGKKMKVAENLKNVPLSKIDRHTGGDYVVYRIEFVRKQIEDVIQLAIESPEEFAKKWIYPRELEDMSSDFLWKAFCNPPYRELERHKEVVQAHIKELEEYYRRLSWTAEKENTDEAV